MSYYNTDKMQIVFFAFLIGFVFGLVMNVICDLVSIVFYSDAVFFGIKTNILQFSLFFGIGVFVLSLWYFLHKHKQKNIKTNKHHDRQR